LTEDEYPKPYVWGWGGGTTLAELSLARFFGCKVTMLTGSAARIPVLHDMGIEVVDRREFPYLAFDEQKYRDDPEFKSRYLDSERRFLNTVDLRTEGRRVSIFLDYIGYSVVRPTLKALARPGILATAGWKSGMSIRTSRAIDCIAWHFHVNTHYARHQDAIEAVRFAEQKRWFPILTDEVYHWDSIPALASDYAAGRLDTYFPIFSVNPV